MTRRAVLGGAAGLCVFGAGVLVGSAHGGGGPHTSSRNARQRVDPAGIHSVATARAEVALTFDDGPDPEYTPAVLAALEACGVRATFFMIGRNAARNPQLVRDVAAAGHAIGNHTMDHVWLDGLPVDGVRYEVGEGHRILTGLDVDPVDLFRPPRGWTSRSVAEVAAERSIRSYFWTDCLEQHLRAGPAGAAAAVSDRAGPGSIILCHDGGTLQGGPNPQREDRSRTVAALPQLLDGLLARGLTPVTVPRLVAGAQPLRWFPLQ